MTLDSIKWLYDRLFNIFIEFTLSLFIKKDERLCILGLKPNTNKKDLFLHNTKYLFLYLSKIENIKTYWLCDDKKMIKEFYNRGYNNVIPRKSIKGIWLILRAKYWFCDVTPNQVSKFNSIISKSVFINLWHGTGGLKKVGFDAGEYSNNFIYNTLKPNINYWIVNSEYEANCRKTGFLAKDNEIKILGSPRLDVLYKDIPNAEIFMEEDFNKIKIFKSEGKKLIIYMPTFRDTGKDISSWLKSSKLQKVLKNNNTILLCKLHPYDKTKIEFSNKSYVYKIANESDVYPILKYTNGLITDYSSIYFDYLHLDKPIIYHIPDLEEYTNQCRGFYRPYETLTAGIYTKTEEDLLNAISNVITGIDNYKEKRKTLLDEMFVYQDGNNCERVANWIESLDK